MAETINDIRKAVVDTLSAIKDNTKTAADINKTLGGKMLVTPAPSGDLVTEKLNIKNTLFYIDSGNLTIQ